MAEYNPSKIIKDGNTYNFRDTTKIPLSGSNQISGNLIPSTDNSIDIGSSTKNLKMLYTKGITINGAQFVPSDYATLSSLSTVATSGSYNDLSNKPTIPTVNDATLTIQKNGTTIDTFTANSSTDKTVNISVPTNTSELTNGAGFITADYAIPRSGGAVMTGGAIGRTVNDSDINIQGGNEYLKCAQIGLFGGNALNFAGSAYILLATGDNSDHVFWFYHNGTLTWDGQPIQYTSDQRLKQQITEIDDKLLDAWQDVNLVQFKYNDAVDQKGDNARLHTGYVVQQIDNACKEHGVDISAYGLYCHEEYPEETEEVEIEQADGTKTKERKVIRDANEHYSLRYTEALIVECKYLRRCIERLTARIEELEKGNNIK